MSVLFANGVRTSLTASVGTGDTSIAVGAATGMPAAGGGDYFMLRLTNVNTMAYEIVKVTGLSGTTLTVVRAQEGTTALAFVSGDRAELRLTAGTLDAIRDELQVNIDAVEQVATDALALANSALTTANATAADLAGRFPIRTADLADECVTTDKLADTVAGDGLTGGAGYPLAVNVDGSTLTINGSNQVQLGDYGITPSKVHGGLLMQFNSTVGGNQTTGTALFCTGPSTGSVFGDDNEPMLEVYMVITNDHMTQVANVQVRRGQTLSYYSGTGSDQGISLYDFNIDNAGSLGGQKTYIPINFKVPPGQRWCVVKGGSHGTPNVTSHQYYGFK